MIGSDRCYLHKYNCINIEGFSQKQVDYQINDLKGHKLTQEDLYFMPSKSFAFRDFGIKRIVAIEYYSYPDFVYPIVSHRAKIIYKRMD